MTRKTPRLYVPLDARFFEDDRVIRAGERAAYLYLAILCAVKADGTNGVITHLKIGRLHVDGWRPRLQKLLDVGLLLELESPELDDVTYYVNAWTHWNLSEVEVLERRRQAQEAARARWSSDPDRNAGRIRTAMQSEKRREKKDVVTLGELVDNLRSGLDGALG